MNPTGLRFNPTGLLKVLRYLWSLPIVRRTVGWLIQAVVTWMINLIKRKKKKQDD